MLVVLDASAGLAMCFRDEQTAAVQRLAMSLESEPATVPSHWPLEVANGLLVAHRRGRLTEAALAATRDALTDLPVEVQSTSLQRALGSVLVLALEYSLTVYDAAYLELAMRESLPLATLDDDLRAAAQRVGVPLAL